MNHREVFRRFGGAWACPCWVGVTDADVPQLLGYGIRRIVIIIIIRILVTVIISNSTGLMIFPASVGKKKGGDYRPS